MQKILKFFLFWGLGVSCAWGAIPDRVGNFDDAFTRFVHGSHFLSSRANPEATNPNGDPRCLDGEVQPFAVQRSLAKQVIESPDIQHDWRTFPGELIAFGKDAQEMEASLTHVFQRRTEAQKAGTFAVLVPQSSLSAAFRKQVAENSGLCCHILEDQTLEDHVRILGEDRVRTFRENCVRRFGKYPFLKTFPPSAAQFLTMGLALVGCGATKQEAKNATLGEPLIQSLIGGNPFFSHEDFLQIQYVDGKTRLENLMTFLSKAHFFPPEVVSVCLTDQQLREDSTVGIQNDLKIHHIPYRLIIDLREGGPFVKGGVFQMHEKDLPLHADIYIVDTTRCVKAIGDSCYGREDPPQGGENHLAYSRSSIVMHLPALDGNTTKPAKDINPRTKQMTS